MLQLVACAAGGTCQLSVALCVGAACNISRLTNGFSNGKWGVCRTTRCCRCRRGATPGCWWPWRSPLPCTSSSSTCQCSPRSSPSCPSLSTSGPSCSCSLPLLWSSTRSSNSWAATLSTLAPSWRRSRRPGKRTSEGSGAGAYQCACLVGSLCGVHHLGLLRVEILSKWIHLGT